MLNLSPGELTLIGSVVTAFLLYLGVRGTSIQSRKAAAAAAGVAGSSAAIDAYDRLRVALEARVTLLEQRESKLTEQAAADHTRIDLLERQVRDQATIIGRLRASIRSLRERYLTALTHIKELRIWSGRPSDPRPDLPEELVDDVSDPPQAR